MIRKGRISLCPMHSPIISVSGLPFPLGNDHVFLIAEIGKNFIQTKEEKEVGEYVANAKRLIDAAAEAGADAVKFQTHEVTDEQLPLKITSPHFPESDRYAWVKRNTEATPETFWKSVKEHAVKRNIFFFSTPMSRRAAVKLEKLEQTLWKIGSGDVRDGALLDFIIQTKKPVILSTGMVSFMELEEIVALFKHHNTPIAILYCVSEYPCPPEAFNLATIEDLRERYPHTIIGFSDHSLGCEAALAAVKLGAKIIEKHFTLSREYFGADHRVSMRPEEFGELVRVIRSKDVSNVNGVSFYGRRGKELSGAENRYRPIFGKSLVVAYDLPEGTTLTEEDVYAMRPSLPKALPAWEFSHVLGKKLLKPVRQYDGLTKELLT